MNFRIDAPFDDVVQMINENELNQLKDFCQLNKARNNNFIFSDFLVIFLSIIYLFYFNYRKEILSLNLHIEELDIIIILFLIKKTRHPHGVIEFSFEHFPIII